MRLHRLLLDAWIVCLHNAWVRCIDEARTGDIHSEVGDMDNVAWYIGCVSVGLCVSACANCSIKARVELG